MAPTELTAHPDFPSDAVEAMAVEAVRLGSTRLRLSYLLAGQLEALALPPSAPPERTDELWRHTCLECFVAAGDPAAGYVELNFSPSSQWAAYRFGGYRQGMAPAEIAAPTIVVLPGVGRLMQTIVSVDLAGLMPPDAPWRCALTAVIEAQGGAKSYWSLAHPPGLPDFHHAAGFALELPPP